PQVAQAFTIVTANAVNGTFSSVNWPSGVSGNINYTATSVEINITGITLPLHLLSFSGSVLPTGRNQLQWKTANETNVELFTIERSAEGLNYSLLLTQHAVGTGNHSYQTTDDNPLAGLNYYRLKMVDKDGRFTYSNAVALKNAAGNVYRLFPNPAENNVLIKHPAGELQASIQVTQSDGKIVKKQKIVLGATETNLDVSQFSPGIYVIQINFGNTMHTLTLIKK
ncbi:MAG: T9SS type A sorting domain-containing protein, partial [Chitinophagaceae bacterium]